MALAKRPNGKGHTTPAKGVQRGDRYHLFGYNAWPTPCKGIWLAASSKPTVKHLHSAARYQIHSHFKTSHMKLSLYYQSAVYSVTQRYTLLFLDWQSVMFFTRYHGASYFSIADNNTAAQDNTCFWLFETFNSSKKTYKNQVPSFQEAYHTTTD